MPGSGSAEPPAWFFSAAAAGRPEECYLSGFASSNVSGLRKQGGAASASLSASVLTSRRLAHTLTSAFSGDACLRLFSRCFSPHLSEAARY